MAIRFASFLGDNAFAFYGAVVDYLGEATGLPTEMVKDTSAGMDALLDGGRIEAAFGCGLPYVWKSAGPDPAVRLLAAPVMPGPRYGGRPVYYSDLIVRADSAFRSLPDLRGARFAYNGETSFSGYVLPLYHLFARGLARGFFGQTLASGSHAASMDWVEAGRADTAAIDSVVLDMEFAQRPARAASFRVVESMGPAGMPPVMIASRVDSAARQRLTEALLGMHTTDRGRAILRTGHVRQFAPVSDQNYDDIRRMLSALEAAGVGALNEGAGRSTLLPAS